MTWAVLPDDMEILRRGFDSLEFISEGSNHHLNCLDDTIECYEDCTTISSVPDAPEMSYFRDRTGTSITLNSAGLRLLGYTANAVNNAVRNGIHPADNNPNFLPLIYNFFHPDSWVTYSNVVLNFYLHPSVTCQTFYCQLARCDGRALPVQATLAASISKDGVYRATFTFKMVERPAPSNSSIISTPTQGIVCP